MTFATPTTYEHIVLDETGGAPPSRTRSAAKLASTRLWPG